MLEPVSPVLLPAFSGPHVRRLKEGVTVYWRERVPSTDRSCHVSGLKAVCSQGIWSPILTDLPSRQCPTTCRLLRVQWLQSPQHTQELREPARRAQCRHSLPCHSNLCETCCVAAEKMTCCLELSGSHVTIPEMPSRAAQHCERRSYLSSERANFHPQMSAGVDDRVKMGC